MVMSSSTWDNVLTSICDPYRQHGITIAPNQAECICPAPLVGTRAFVHILHPPANNLDYVKLSTLGSCNRVVEVLGALWNVHCGFSLFCSQLSAFGSQPALLDRSPLNPIPFDILTSQLHYPWLNSQRVVVGDYRYNPLVLQCETGQVELSNRSTGEALQTWPHLFGAIEELALSLNKERDWRAFVPSWRTK